MNKLFKAIAFALLMSVIPARTWAQADPYKVRENGFLFNVYKIENVEERIQLASALATSDIWICNPTDNPGELFIRPNSYNADLPIVAEFDYLLMTLHEEYEEVSLMPKEEFADAINSWAQNISIDYYNFLIADRAGDRANHCLDAEPFCTDNTYNFYALNSGFSWAGPDYGCLGSSPTNKHSFWYYMRIGVAGNITIKLEADFDVDFALWGPFDNQIDPCPLSEGEVGMLTSECSYCPNNTNEPNFYPSGNLHDCSFDARHYEYAHVVDGQVGQYFILLITNYSGDSGDITFQKYAGDGETDCGIMPPLVNNNGPFCTGETIQLSANGQSGATYSWTGPNGFTSTEQNPALTNATLEMSGEYTCTITLGTATNHASTEVIVDPMPEPTASAQPSSILYGSNTQLNADPGVEGEFNYHWEPEDMVVDPDAQNPQTVNLTSSQLFTVTVTSIHSGCTGTAEVSVPVGSGLTVTASADEYTLCEGNSTTLHAHPFNGTGNYTYIWEPAGMLDDANTQDPVATPSVGTTTFTCQVSDGLATQNVNVTILVNPNAEPTHIYESICANDTYYFYGEPVTTTSYKEHLDHTQFGCDSLVCLHLTVNPNAEPTYIYDSICPGETYYFYGEPITTTSYEEHLDHNQFGCDSIVCLYLTRNPTYDSIIIIDTCDFYEWESLGKTIKSYHYEHEIEDDFITQKGIYQRTYESIYRCDSVVTIDATFEYSPNPYDYIMSPDPSIGEATHAVITASEFQINTYDFIIREQGQSQWETVTWTLKDQNGNDVDWAMDIVDNSQLLHLTVFGFVPGRVYLTATATNDCGSKSVTHWLECTFYGIEEEAENHVNVDIVPNPNNGQMALNFEQLTGKVNVKVYNMSGDLIDSFETHNEMGNGTMTYNMKQRSAGIYYFVFTSKEGSITKKVVVTQ